MFKTTYKDKLLKGPRVPRKTKSQDVPKKDELPQLRPSSRKTPEPEISYHFISYVYPDAIFTCDRTQSALKIKCVKSYNQNFVRANLYRNDQIIENCYIYENEAGIFMAYNYETFEKKSTTQPITPVSKPNLLLNTAAIKLTDYEFSKFMLFTSYPSQDSTFTPDNFEHIMESRSALFSFSLSENKTQWLEHFLVKKQYFNCDCRYSTPKDFFDENHCCNPDTFLRIVIDAIISKNKYFMLENGTIGMMHLGRNYPHIIHIKPGCISVYDGGKYCNVDKMMCNGHNTHPLTMLIILTVFLQKYPEMPYEIVSKYFAKLNSDLIKHSFIKTPAISLLALIHNFSLNKCIAADNDNITHQVDLELAKQNEYKQLMEDFTKNPTESDEHEERFCECDVSCPYGQKYLLHLIYLSILRNSFSAGFPPIGNRDFKELNIKYRDQIIDVHFRESDIDAAIYPKIDTNQMMNIQKELINKLSGSDIYDDSTFMDFLNKKMKQFQVSVGIESGDKNIFRTILESATGRSMSADGIRKIDMKSKHYSDFFYELEKIYYVRFRTEFKYENVMNADYGCWVRGSIWCFISAFCPDFKVGQDYDDYPSNKDN